MQTHQIYTIIFNCLALIPTFFLIIKCSWLKIDEDETIIYNSIRTFPSDTFIGNVVCEINNNSYTWSIVLASIGLILMNIHGYLCAFCWNKSCKLGLIVLSVPIIFAIACGALYSIYNYNIFTNKWSEYSDDILYPDVACSSGYSRVLYDGLFNETGCTYFQKYGNNEYLTICCANFDTDCQSIIHSAHEFMIYFYTSLFSAIGCIVVANTAECCFPTH